MTFNVNSNKSFVTILSMSLATCAFVKGCGCRHEDRNRKTIFYCTRNIFRALYMKTYLSFLLEFKPFESENSYIKVIEYFEILVSDGPPLWSSGQSSWLQIRRPRFDSRHYQKK
jgi:hypothetical protein